MTGKPPELSDVTIDPFTGSTSYESLLGREGWRRLHPDIRTRFCLSHARQDVVYRGVMHEVVMSRIGKLLAYFCRLIGTPLTYLSGRQIPVVVKVYRNPQLRGMTWDRYYYFPNGRRNRVRSTKVILSNNELVEVVGAGFGMFLKVFEDNGALCFTSTHFFWSIANTKIPLPHIFSPGKTTVHQAAMDDGSFQFSLHIQHRLFGTVMRQTGTFREAV